MSQKDSPKWPTINLVTPLEAIGYGDGVPHPPIQDPGPLFYLTLLIVGTVVLKAMLWLHS